MKSVEIRNHSDVIVGNGVVLFVVLSPHVRPYLLEVDTHYLFRAATFSSSVNNPGGNLRTLS